MQDAWSRLDATLDAVKRAGVNIVGENLPYKPNGAKKSREQILKEYRAQVARIERRRKRWPGW